MVLLSFMIMKKFSVFFLLLFVAALCLSSCKSIGYRVRGTSTIYRSDTIHSIIMSSHPATDAVIVDY